VNHGRLRNRDYGLSATNVAGRSAGLGSLRWCGRLRALKGRNLFALSVWHVARAFCQPVAAVERQMPRGEARRFESRGSCIERALCQLCLCVTVNATFNSSPFGAHRADAARKGRAAQRSVTSIEEGLMVSRRSAIPVRRSASQGSVSFLCNTRELLLTRVSWRGPGRLRLWWERVGYRRGHRGKTG
jgi:hypothetical protein